MGALFLPEAGRIAGQCLRELILGQNLVDKLANHGVLGGSDQIEVLSFNLVHHGIHIVLAHDAFHHISVDHKGRDTVDKALVDHEVTGIGQHGGVQTGDVSHEIIEAVSGGSAGGIHVNAVEAFHDLGMIGNLIVRHHRVAEALNFDVAAVIRSERNGGIDDIRNEEHALVNLIGIFRFQLLQLRQTLVIGFDSSHVRVDFGLDGGLFLFRGLFHLSEERTVCLAQFVFLGAQVAGFGNGGAVFRIQVNDLVHQRELCILIFFPDVFLHEFRILPDKSDIQHSFLLYCL